MAAEPPRYRRSAKPTARSGKHGDASTAANAVSEAHSEPRDRSRPRAFEVLRLVAERFSTNHPYHTHVYLSANSPGSSEINTL